jgi:hypothetical protein
MFWKYCEIIRNTPEEVSSAENEALDKERMVLRSLMGK